MTYESVITNDWIKVLVLKKDISATYIVLISHTKNV
jgi:hypothetical protein